MRKDFYSVLGVPRSATRVQIKERFRELVRTRHPDRFQGAERQHAEADFQAITEAFNVLSDGERRRQHDLDLDRPTSRSVDTRQLSRHYLARGVRAYREGNFLEAANNFSRATEVEPRNGKLWYHLALTCLQEERWLTKAREAIEHAVERAPENATYWKLGGKIFARSGMTGPARQYYNRALRVGGPDPAIHKALEELDGPPPDKTKPRLFGKSR